MSEKVVSNMAKSLFKTNAVVIIDGKHFTLLRKIDADIWQLENQRDKRIIEYSITELRKLYSSKELIFSNEDTSALLQRDPGKPHRNFSEKQWAAAKIRRYYVLGISGLPSTRAKLIPIIHQIWQNLGELGKPPSADAVIRWKRMYQQAGEDIVGIIDRDCKKGNRLERYSSDVIEIAEKAIDEVYLTEERKTVQDVLDHVDALINDENALRPDSLKLPRPTRRFLKRLIEKIDAYDRCVARHGRLIANRRFRSVLRNRVTRAPLERAEIDHTKLDLMAIDDDSGLPLGRPYLTICIDDFSRCILGIYIGFEPPSYMTVAHCLKHAFMPKDNLREQYPKVNGEWVSHGVMSVLVVDNGPEFHSISLENACYNLGIDIQYSARKTPWFKGKVERVQGTLNREVAHGAPGTTFSNIFEKEEYDPEKHAVVRLSVLKEIIHIWIVDMYHERVHRTLKAPPVAMWKSSISDDDIYLPDDPARLDAIMGRVAERRLTHKGIEFDGLFYNSPELTTLRRRLGDILDVEIRVDEANIGRIYVLSPDKNRIFDVPAVNITYANGLSAWQHKTCKRFAAKEMQSYSVEGWLKAKQKIAAIIADEVNYKKIKNRARLKSIKVKNDSENQTAQAVLPPPTAVPSAQKNQPSTGVSTPLSSEVAKQVPEVDCQKRHFTPVLRIRN